MPKTNGCVKWYHTKKGYGFISSLKDEKDYFVHISGIQLTDGKDGFKTLKQGSVTNAFVLKSFDICHRP